MFYLIASSGLCQRLRFNQVQGSCSMHACVLFSIRLVTAARTAGESSLCTQLIGVGSALDWSVSFHMKSGMSVPMPVLTASLLKAKDPNWGGLSERPEASKRRCTDRESQESIELYHTQS